MWHMQLIPAVNVIDVERTIITITARRHMNADRFYHCSMESWQFGICGGHTFEEIQHLLAKVILTHSADKADLDTQPAKCSCNIGWCTSWVRNPCLDLLLWDTPFLC